VSISWKASVPIVARGTWPVIAMIGTESSRASATAVRRLVAPGPEVPKQTAGFPVARALLVPGQDVPDGAGVEGVVQGQVGPAGDAADAGDALAFEEFQDELCAGEFHGVLLLTRPHPRPLSHATFLARPRKVAQKKDARSNAARGLARRNLDVLW